MTKKFLALLCIAFCCHLAPAAEVENSVVQIFSFSQGPDWESPWRFTRVGSGSGTGFVIKGKRIMTNAHVVSDGRQILVKRYQDPQPYPAKVTYIGHECDLAILELEDESFFEGMDPLPIGNLPAVRSTVVTYGYPAGGEQISYTRGVVSRIEVQTYVHAGNRAFLTAQTDAAINPGNSGGPVIQNYEVVGVAFMGTPGLENTGFIIPPTIINHFLEDIDDGKYDGFPKAGIQISSLQNPAYRKRLKLPSNNLGAIVDRILRVPTTQKVLQEDDVILEVNGYPVGSDGTIIYEGNRVSATTAFQLAQAGESIGLTIWRDGTEKKISLPMEAYDKDLHQGNQYGVQPRYFVYGGLVFTPLSLDYLKTFGRNWSGAANSELIYELSYRERELPDTVRSEPIVLSAVLPHAANANLRMTNRLLVDKINGIKIDRLEDVIRALETQQVAQHAFEFSSQGSFECLDRAAAEKANAEILETYRVPSDRHL